METTLRRVGAVILILGLSAAGAGCDDADWKVLETTAQWNRIGKSQDQWLEKKSAFGPWDKVALIFGYADDYEGCVDVIEALVQKYPAAHYRCVPAN